jgi:D-glycero-beta-D-manno-heptose-7-phosphate kinase
MPVSPERVGDLTSKMGRARIMILGDIMVDEYLLGSVTRISPEAPVPIVEIQSSKVLLGGAANVAANIRALGDEPILIGAVGRDHGAARLADLLAEKGISNDFLVSDPTRQTTTKTRIIAHSQQIVRADREDRFELNEEIEQRIFRRFLSVADEVQALVISDYGKGVITKTLLERVIDHCIRRNIYVAVDPKETHFYNYKKVSLITPNHHEAGFAYGRRIVTEKDLIEVGNGLLDRLEAKSILITRGPDGMSLFSDGRPPTHIPTFARKVFDVTGAGDTVIAVFVSAVCAGAELSEAAIISNAGAGITVREVGTATVTPDQLRDELAMNIKDGALIKTTSGLL